MPNQRSRVRWKAAPVNLAAPDVIVDGGEASLSEIYRPPQRRRNPSVKSSTTVIDEQNTSTPSVDPNTNSVQVIPTLQPVPSANEIVTLVIQKFFDMPCFQMFYNSSQISSAVNVEEGTNSRQTVYRLQPPVTSDPERVANRSEDSLTNLNVANGNSADEDAEMNSCISPYSYSMLKHSLLLDFHVNEKMRTQIWSDNYIDLVALLPNFQDNKDDILYENSSLKISNKVKSKQLSSILQWSNAFDLFMSIYILKHANSALSLIKYAYTMPTMSRQFGLQAVQSYDEQFSKVRKLMNLDWGLINDEMWRMAAFGTRNSGNQSSMSTSQFKGLKNGHTPFQKRAQQSQSPAG
jgi:hypothetical protein